MSHNDSSENYDPLATSVEMIELASEYAKEYLANIGARRVAPDAAAVMALDALDIPLPLKGNSPANTIELLSRYGGPATVARRWAILWLGRWRSVTGERWRTCDECRMGSTSHY